MNKKNVYLQKKSSNKNKQNDYNISEVQKRIKMLKTKFDVIDKDRINIRSLAMTNQNYEQWCYDCNFPDNVSNKSS